MKQILILLTCAYFSTKNMTEKNLSIIPSKSDNYMVPHYPNHLNDHGGNDSNKN